MRVNQSIDDPTFLQLNDRSSELPFCCKRGHSAILPPLQFPPAKWPLQRRLLHLIRSVGRARIALVLRSCNSAANGGGQEKREDPLVWEMPAPCRTRWTDGGRRPIDQIRNGLGRDESAASNWDASQLPIHPSGVFRTSQSWRLNAGATLVGG